MLAIPTPRIRPNLGGEQSRLRSFDDDWEGEAAVALELVGGATAVSGELSAEDVWLSCVASEPVVDPGMSELAEALEKMGVETAGKLDCVGIPTVLNNGFDVDMDAVASGPMVIGTLMMAQSSATAENVSVSRKFGREIITQDLNLLSCSVALQAATVQLFIRSMYMLFAQRHDHSLIVHLVFVSQYR
jgi:hypothetical protein